MKESFEVEANSLWDLLGQPHIGYRIPIYQRKYSWDMEKIDRAYESCRDGFMGPDKMRTFLGTIILVADNSYETSFKGTSMSVVDGQQRLITLTMFCCSLIEELCIHGADLEDLPDDAQKWGESEYKFHLNALFNCVAGEIQGRSKSIFFPKIIREEKDHRALNINQARYNSDIGDFLYTFAKKYSSETHTPFEFDIEKEFKEKYEHMKTKVKSLYSEDFQNFDFNQESVKALFEKLDMLPDKRTCYNILSKIEKESSTAQLFKLILFSSYITKSVTLAVVKTPNEDSAFDIFDALNTTGEPLTALETFKPRVVKYENVNGNYTGSKSQAHLDEVEQYLAQLSETGQRHKETSELLTSFALYLDGTKLSLDLSKQRTYLKDTYGHNKILTNLDLRRKFVSSIADVASFRFSCWNPDGIGTLGSNFSSEIRDAVSVLKLCLIFIHAMKTSIAIPAMARYWAQYQEGKLGDSDYIAAVKSIAAFIILRRTVTGGTGDIDTDFRKLMQTSSNSKASPLCAGIDHSHELLSVDNLREELRYYLDKQGINGLDSWIEQAYAVPLARHAKPLCRFLILAASHQARPDVSRPGFLTRKDVVPAQELKQLDFENWKDLRYATVEHIAPDAVSSENWDPKIYSQPHIRHTLGNLILLPQKDNSNIGNADWVKKKIFYAALAAEKVSERDERIKEAQNAGFGFTNRTIKLLRTQERLSLLDPLQEFEQWTQNIIEKRSRNLLKLAWEEISPWLF